MEKIVIDSHALFWFLTNNPKLSQKAKKMILQAEQIIIPSIVLLEILYLLEKNNLTSRFIEILNEIRIRKYLIYPLDLEIITQTLFLNPNLEMHDRIIVATATLFNSPLISKDKEIRKYYKKTIW